MSVQLRHRHVLVAPVFAVVLMTSFFVPTLEASLLSVHEVYEQENLRLEPLKNASITMSDTAISLTRGSALAIARGEASFNAGAAVIELSHGAAFVHVSDSSITVVALTSPALVRIDTEETIVSVHRQWQWDGLPLPAYSEGIDAWWAARKTQPVPRTFLRDYLQKLVAEDVSVQATESDNTALTLFHPDMRDADWQKYVVSTKSSEAILYLLAFPSSDLLSESASEEAHAAYAELVRPFLEIEAVDTAFVQALRDEWTIAMVESKEQTYPVRAAFYESLVKKAEAVLPHVSVEEVDTTTQSQTGSQVVATTCTPLDGEGIAAVEAWLRSSRAAFTTDTKITQDTDEMVRVESIVFAGQAGDRLLSFVVDTACGTVQNIQLDGQVLPFALSLEAFGNWIRQ